MEHTILNRQQLLSWLGSGGLAGSNKLASDLRLDHGEVALVWPGRAGEAAPLLVVRDEDERLDLLAFAGTYVTTFVPFTKFFRVLTLFDFEGANRREPKNHDALKRCIVGAVLSKAASSDKELSRIRLADCLSSYSFALGKAAVAGMAIPPGHIFSRWDYCSSVLGVPSSSEGTIDLRFWDVLFAALGLQQRERDSKHQRGVVEVVRWFLDEGLDAQMAWPQIMGLAPHINVAYTDMTGPREARARAFTNALSDQTLPDLGVVGDLVAGYLAALLGGGSLEYSSMVSGFDPVYPTASLWFGLFSASARESDVLVAGRSLGRHILLELGSRTELFDEPTCDISFEELSLSARNGGLPLNRFRLTEAVSVELFPGFECGLRVRKERNVPRTDEALPREGLYEARKLVARLSVLLDGKLAGDDLFDHSKTARVQKKVRR